MIARRLLWVAAGAVLGWHAAIAAVWATSREPAEDAERWRPPHPREIPADDHVWAGIDFGRPDREAIYRHPGTTSP